MICVINLMIPDQINYGSFKPKGFYTQFKEWAITPLSSNQYWQPDELIRFLVTIKSGVMDPYRSQLVMKVSTFSQNHPVGSLQIDSSAQSLIAQSVVSSNNVQLQRIAQYDTLAAYLTDVGFSEFVCESRESQGLGYSNTATHAPWSTTHAYGSQFLYNWTGTALQLQSASTGLIMPTTASSWTGRGNNALANDTGGHFSALEVMGNTTVAPSGSNILWQGVGQGKNLDTVRQDYGRFGNVRNEYMTGILSRNYPDASGTVLMTSPHVLNQTWNVESMTGTSATSGYNPKAPYEIKFPTTSHVSSYINGTQTNLSLPLDCCLYGYQKPIAGEFARGTNQVFISPTVPQCQMQNGLLTPTKMAVSSQIFRFPLISAICGILIPPDQFLLIPMKALYNTLIQLTLSRYAMFTSGYSDVHEFDQVGMQTMQKRNWAISEVVWNLHLYTFADSQINAQIDASLVKQIPVSTTMYSLASQFQLPNGSLVRNTWNVGTQAESLCEIICLFISNQYQLYSFCRKQFRLSNCITSMQIKFNSEYYPSQPIIGNAGNPQYLDTTGDNWEFYKQLLLSNNYLFNTNIPLPKINTRNFAVNKRCYDPTRTTTFYDPKMYGNFSYNWNYQSVNSDTAMGMPSFHQNRYIGKAAFVYSWEPYGHSKNFMNGINASGVQNFGVIFNNSSDSVFPSDQTLLIFSRQNALIVYSDEGIKVLGK